MRTLPLFAGLVCLCACGGKEPQQPPAPPLPVPPMAPFLDTLKALAASAPAAPEAARRELQDLGEIALQLVEAEPRTAARAERALLEHAHAAFVLEPALAHAEVAVRRRAAWLCGRSGQGALQLPLLLRLKYELDPEAVLWVADALQHLGNDTGLGWLDAAMGEQRTAQQAGTLAIEICTERGITLPDPPTYAALQQAMRELGEQWRRTGIGSRPGLVAPEPKHVEPRLAAHLVTTEGTLLRPIDDAKYVISRSGALAVPLLVRTLSASEHYLRTVSLGLLADLGPCAASAGPAVQALLGDPFTCCYAMRTLGEIGDATAIPHLRASLRHEDSERRSEAARALGLLRDAESGAALRQRLEDPAETMDVRVHGAFALCCLGPDPAARAFLDERAAKKDYHEATLNRLLERLQAKR
ncbi:MAG: hypothetical protein FJ265_17350 [Planctomycetes bacterium]|nr:hypothetical protein [Planctomycetota bacterium]